jgi:ubiquinone/menaquinone biosynthesis C-methylase UbiE
MTTYDPGWIRSHLGERGEADLAEESRPTARISYEIHLHYLRQFLTGNERVLEIGAGVGKLTGALASLTRRVVVADISSLKLQLNQRNARAAGYVDAVEAWVESDVVNLTQFGDDEFDAVVCYGGPLSYVFDQRDRALQELLRVTRVGGVLFLSVRSLWGSIHMGFPSMLAHDPRFIREVVRTGDLGPDKVAVTGSFLHAYRAEEFRAFVEATGARIEVLTASGVLSETWDELLVAGRLDKAVWREVIDLELEASRSPGCIDMGSHVIAVARKV